MRKTVYEWLEINHNGQGMAKKKVARIKAFKRRATSHSQVEQTFKKQLARSTSVSKRPK
jgi:hypothetical protein